MSTITDRIAPSRKKKAKALKKKATNVAQDVAQEAMEEIRESAAEYYELGREKVEGAASRFERYVREQPIKSLLIAAGAGLIFGRFWMRR
jgi:ElaB/YqjD/DUF883 family membrane-anchored ribosome-binding protein